MEADCRPCLYGTTATLMHSVLSPTSVRGEGEGAEGWGLYGEVGGGNVWATWGKQKFEKVKI